jgi:hypothetical protein
LRPPLADITSPASDTYHHARLYHEGLGPIIEAVAYKIPLPSDGKDFGAHCALVPGRETAGHLWSTASTLHFVAVAKRLRTSNLGNIAT